MRNPVTHVLVGVALALAGAVGCNAPEPATKAAATGGAPASGLDRTVLPIAEPQLSARDRTGRARCEGAAPVRGESAQGRTERHRVPDR